MKNPRFTVLAALILLALAIPLANARSWDNNRGNDNSNNTPGAVYIMTNDPQETRSFDTVGQATGR